MEALFFIICIVVTVGLIVLGLDLYVNRLKTPVPSNNTLTLSTKPPKNIKTNIANSYSHKNEKSNFQKKRQKSRNQGKLQFYFHGEYYPTGLMLTMTNGGK